MMHAPKLEVISTSPVTLAVAPSIALRIRATFDADTLVHAIVLRARIRVDAAKRTYSSEEKNRLRELFGTAEQWQTTIRVPLSWAEVSVSVGRFTGTTTFDVVVPCTYDLAVATTKLFDALDGGSVPLTIVFSGTVFAERDSEIAIVPLASDVEARCEVPVATWRELMDAHHPMGVLVPLKRDLVNRLRAVSGEPTLEHAIEKLLRKAEAS